METQEIWKNLSIENLTKEIDGIIYVEEWRPIVGYEGQYEVSSFGRVKSVGREILIKSRNGNKFNIFWKERIRISRPENNYIYITLCKKGGKKNLVHRLVAMAFHPNPENKRTVNHKNVIKSDNWFRNLEWATYSENEKHAYNTGLKANDKGVSDSQSIPISQYTKDGVWIRNWGSCKEIQRETGFSQGNISKCVKGDSGYKTQYGFIWRKASVPL